MKPVRMVRTLYGELCVDENVLVNEDEEIEEEEEEDNQE